MPDSNKSKITAKIDFIERQLISLDHYLPQTYEYLMAELDEQRMILAELEVNEQFKSIDIDPRPSVPSKDRGKKSVPHRSKNNAEPNRA